MTARSVSQGFDGPGRKRGHPKAGFLPQKRNEGHSEKLAGTSSAPVLSTRVCIKNIPPSFTSVKLRDFLTKEYRERQRHSNKQDLVITDCTVLMHAHKKNLSRRIAFAGFQSMEMAQRVIEFFDQTFALTARLSVEPAKGSIKTMKERESANSKKTANDSVHPKEKKQLEQQQQNQEQSAGSRTTKELLLAGAAKKSKFWSNDLDLTVNETSAAANSAAASEINKDSAKEESVEDKADADYSSNSDADSVASDSSEDGEDPLMNVAEKANVVSDLDFLKSKQSMVDDLDAEAEDEPQQDDSPPQEGKLTEDDVADLSSDADEFSDRVTSGKDSSKGKDGSLSTKTVAKAEKSQSDSTKDDTHQSTEPVDDETGVDDGSGEDDTATTQLASNRLFVRNLPFSTTEEQLEEHFSTFGAVQECHVPVDDRKMSKGFAFVTFEKAQDADVALQELDGRDFQGRFIHVLPSRQKPQSDSAAGAASIPLSYKERQELARRQDAAKSTKGWSASFVRGDAVVDSLADRLGIRKGDILNVKDGLNSGDAAVRLALGETQVIEENRDYFTKHGVDMEALVSLRSTEDGPAVRRSNSSILVKNLPYDTQIEELTKLLASAGEAPKRVLLPPSRTIALADYDHESDAKKAFRKLAYRRFKNVPVYLEWAPIAAVIDPAKSEEKAPTIGNEDPPEEEAALDLPTPSIYIKNLNFSTTETRLRQMFDQAVGDVRAVRIPKKAAPVKKPGVHDTTSNNHKEELQPLSMGFGFVEFGSQESARKALSKLQGCLVDGHALELKPSTKSLTQPPVKVLSGSKKNPTKVAVRNVPFQASRTELLKLFGSYGQLKRVRLPKKFDGGHRGFAFVEFVTHKEALAAMKSLSRTHLYGRHLVLEWAEDETEDPDNGLNVLRNRAQRDVDRQELSADKEKRSKKRQKLS